MLSALWLLLLDRAPGLRVATGGMTLLSLGSGLLLGVRTVLVRMGTWPCQAALPPAHPTPGTLLGVCHWSLTPASLWKLGPGLFLSCSYSLASGLQAEPLSAF